MLATWINAAAIIIGSLLGFLFKKRLPASLLDALLQVLSLVVIAIGVGGMLDNEYIIWTIISLSVGTLIGESIHLEKLVTDKLSTIEKRFSNNQENGWFTKGFITATVLFGVGAMSIIGSFEAGLFQNYEILFTKSTLDFVAAMLLTASLGIGVLFSAFVILLYQGALTLLAASLATLVANTASIALLSVTGSALILALGLNMVKATNIKVTNMIPSLLIALVIGYFL
jgi:uncharacterized membrane protein YqgA involved in biofilm formation